MLGPTPSSDTIREELAHYLTSNPIAVEMEDTNLKISVVIPTCHRNDLLAKCLDCLAPGVQSLPADLYEVIVSDDGSKSTSEQMIAEHYPWAKWTQGPRKGPAANRNHGAAQAVGIWIVFTDDDCLPDTTWLQAFTDAIGPEINVYEGRTTCRDWPNSPVFEAPINETGGCLWSCNFMINRILFEELNGFDERFPYAAMEDVDLRERIQDLRQPTQFVGSAVVDHPARPRSSRPQRLRAREANVMYAIKWHGKAHLWCNFEAYFYRKYRSQILRGPHRLKTVVCLCSVYVDFLITLARIGGWRRNARMLFDHDKAPF